MLEPLPSGSDHSLPDSLVSAQEPQTAKISRQVAQALRDSNWIDFLALTTGAVLLWSRKKYLASLRYARAAYSRGAASYRQQSTKPPKAQGG